MIAQNAPSLLTMISNLGLKLAYMVNDMSKMNVCLIYSSKVDNIKDKAPS